uniref:Tumor necrosis factor, alpha-induced protein 2b n=1 Tax=Astyanax mexicanus TaxID=7994 RepID=W5K2Y5_ASTMX
MTAGSLADRAVSSSKPKFLKLPKFFKKNNVQNNDIKCKGKTLSITHLTIPLTFKQNLNEKRFLVAAKQLINREERLFSVKQDGVGSNKSRVEEEEDDEERLRKDSEDLFKAVWYTVENTFEVQTEKEKEALKQAVLVLQQEDEQDRRWQGVGEKERPLWRPLCCRKTHGSLLQNMVERRMDEAMPDSSVGIQSSIQKEIIGKGKRLKEDLLHVAKHVRCCYPEDNVCQLYATLYHQAFSTKLREIADFGLSDEDCEYVLQWVKYTKLGTREWLKNSENVCTELLDGLNEHILNFTKLDKTCLKELLSQLHKEVLAEYVRKTMKKKIKLTDEKKQEQAAKALRDNSQKIQALFSEAGSNLDDLREILPKLAEVLTLKDPQFIALEIVKLSRDYPDFSEAHACAWLYLKANLSTSDQKNIKKTFSEFREPDLLDGQDRDQDQEQDPLYSSRNFFSKVLLN